MKNVMRHAIKALSFVGLFIAATMLTPDRAGATSTVPVDVVNTPEVRIAGLTPGQPVVVRDGDNPARTGITVSASATPGQGSYNAVFGTVYTVPAGQRLVIEYISAQVAIDHGFHPLTSVDFGVSGAEITIPCSLVGTRPGNAEDEYFCNQVARGYVDAGQTVSFGAEDLDQVANAPQDLQMYITMSGYLVSMP